MTKEIFPPDVYSNDDQRYLPRWEVSNRVLYQLQNEYNLHQGQTRDLSCAGACIMAPVALEHQKIKLTVFLSAKSSVMLEGCVLWSRQSSADHAEIGIGFENASPEAQDLILQHAFEVKRETVVNHWFEGWNPPSPLDPA